jgi:hypothetical protein
VETTCVGHQLYYYSTTVTPGATATESICQPEYTVKQTRMPVSVAATVLCFTMGLPRPLTRRFRDASLCI